MQSNFGTVQHMPTQYDFYEMLNEGRWQPDIKLTEAGEKGFTASWQFGNKKVERSSIWSASQAEGDLMEEIRRGTLEGEYFPTDF